MRVERMTRQSIDAVCAIERISFFNPWSKSCFLDELGASDAHHFVLIRENPPQSDEIIAYLCCRAVLDELYILKIAVHPMHRRKGIATAFLDHCLHMPALKNILSVILDVRESNAAAIALYQQLGFQMAGKRPNYYTDTGEDAYLLRKMIKGVGK